MVDKRIYNYCINYTDYTGKMGTLTTSLINEPNVGSYDKEALLRKRYKKRAVDLIVASNKIINGISTDILDPVKCNKLLLHMLVSRIKSTYDLHTKSNMELREYLNESLDATYNNIVNMVLKGHRSSRKCTVWLDASTIKLKPISDKDNRYSPNTYTTGMRVDGCDDCYYYKYDSDDTYSECSSDSIEAREFINGAVDIVFLSIKKYYSSMVRAMYDSITGYNERYKTLEIILRNVPCPDRKLQMDDIWRTKLCTYNSQVPDMKRKLIEIILLYCNKFVSDEQVSKVRSAYMTYRKCLEETINIALL